VNIARHCCRKPATIHLRRLAIPARSQAIIRQLTDGPLTVQGNPYSRLCLCRSPGTRGNQRTCKKTEKHSTATDHLYPFVSKVNNSQRHTNRCEWQERMPSQCTSAGLQMHPSRISTLANRWLDLCIASNHRHHQRFCFTAAAGSYFPPLPERPTGFQLRKR
jgi:hypothetical protein